MSEQVHVMLSDSAVYSRVNEETGVVLELTRKRYYTLSATAADVLEMLQRSGRVAVEDVVQQLFERYEVDRKTLEADVRECLLELRKRRVVELAGQLAGE